MLKVNRSIVLEYAGVLAGDRGTRLLGEQGLVHTCLSQSDSMMASVLQDNLTEPLLLKMGLEGLHPTIVLAEKLLNQGAFQNLRELELKLSYDAMIAAGSQEIFEDFLEFFSSLCERMCIINGQDPMYHVSFHTRGVDTIWRNYQTQQPMTDQKSDEAEWTANVMSSNDSPTEVDSYRPLAGSKSTSTPSGTPLTEASRTHYSSPRPKSSLYVISTCI